jgi:alpha-N-arabinofuranosidase
MTEEINHSYDGGLYAELVRNRAFKDDPRNPAFWTPVGEGATVELATSGGVTPQSPAFLKVKGGVANPGYWGIPVFPKTRYSLTVWAKSDAPGSIVARIESTDGSKVFAQATIEGLDASWRKLTASLSTERGIGQTKDARLVLLCGDNRAVSLGPVSLFPPTYGDRPNGFRRDIFQLLVDFKPSFLRFPGGNYVEGGSFQDRFNWNETVGPIENRPGHWAPWGYRSSDGMGLLEYLIWCEDMRAKPVLAVFAGYALNGQHVDSGPQMDEFVQDALDEIEYVVGGTDTKWGAQRARDGHPNPFELECVEIGNEDGFDRSHSYEKRFVAFYDAIKKRYPGLRAISTTGGKDWLGSHFPITLRKPDLVDEHYYSSTWDMMAMATRYDSYDRKGPKVFVGEWASQNVDAPWAAAGEKGPTSNMGAAIADAAFMTGLERNSDIVEMACYAPLLVNVNPGARQWAVNLIGYDALTSFGSPSYYAQKMFSRNLGDRTVEFTLKGVPNQVSGDRTLPGLFVSATIDTAAGTLFVKVVNALGTPEKMEIDVEGAKVVPEGVMTTLSGAPSDVNDTTRKTNILPRETRVSSGGASFAQVFAPHSVNVLKLKIR